jgi:cytochrome c oxidase subunit 4
VPSARHYSLVAVVLLLLLASTLVLAGVNLGMWNTPIALGIAATKAILIAWFFMELRDAFPLPRLAAAVALLWLSILLLGALDDLLTRGWLTTPGH